MSEVGNTITRPSDTTGSDGAIESVLMAICAEMREFTQSTEREFLDVGEALHAFHRRSGELSARASAVVDLLHGEEIQRIMEDLQGLLDRMTRHADSLDNDSKDTESSLRKVLVKLERVDEAVAGFRKIVKTMTILGLSTKIENARNVQDEESFNILADDLVKLAHNIDLQARHVQEHLQGIESLVRDALHKVHTLKIQRRHQTENVFVDSLEHVSLLWEKNQLSSRSAEDIALLSQSVSEKIGNIVASIQFHDLTRQQIDHVLEAFDDLVKWVGSQREEGALQEEIDSHVAHVCPLQHAQLEHSREQILTAVNDIRSSLSEIAVSILSMAEQTETVAGMTNKAGLTFMAEMEQGTALIASVLHENVDATRASVSIFSSLARSVLEMEDFLHEIERIGGEMKVLALNAGIKAARISEGGAGLSVIAGAIQKLSGSALLQTTSVSRLLRDITETAQNLSAEEGMGLERQGGTVQEFLDEVGSLLQSLRALSDGIVSHLKGVGEGGRSLAGEIELTISSIGIQEKAREVFETILEDIRRLSPFEGSGISGKALKGASGVYRDLMGRYTMHSEREVHQSIVGQCEGSETGQGARDSASEFGDNVELF